MHAAPIPYVTLRSAEQPQYPQLAYDYGDLLVPIGVRYEGELDEDRDADGVLWARHLEPEGDPGRPVYLSMHPERQEQCLGDLLCQVCKDPADESEAGVLWLLRDEPQLHGPDWPEGACVGHPPLCLEHAAPSVLACPYLAPSWRAVRVAHPDPGWGYAGTLYRASQRGPVLARQDAVLALADPRVGWLVARERVARLSGCTAVDLAAELRARNLPLADEVEAAQRARTPPGSPGPSSRRRCGPTPR